MRASGLLSRCAALVLAGACVPVALLALPAGLAQGQEAASPGADKTLNDLATNTCEKCHNTTDWAGSLAMDSLDLGHTDQDPEVWEKAITKLRGRLMPPAGEKQPDQAEVDAVIHYLETSLDAAAKNQAAAKAERVGHVPIQRLNRTEFAAAVRDLIGVQVDPKQVLPTEIEVEGLAPDTADHVGRCLGEIVGVRQTF